MRELKIRHMSEDTVARIDEQAKIYGKSRSVFLQEYLDAVFVNDSAKTVFDEIHDVNRRLRVIEVALKKILEKVEEE